MCGLFFHDVITSKRKVIHLGDAISICCNGADQFICRIIICTYPVCCTDGFCRVNIEGYISQVSCHIVEQVLDHAFCIVKKGYAV